MAKRGIEDQEATLNIREAFKTYEKRVEKEGRAGTADNSFNEVAKQALNKNDDEQGSYCSACGQALDN